MTLSLIARAAELPVSLATCKALCGIESTSFDAQLELLRGAAHRRLGGLIGSSLGTDRWQLTLDEFAEVIDLAKGPAVAIVTFTHRTTGGTFAAVPGDLYYTDLVSHPARIVLAEGASWPELGNGLAGVQITFDAGWVESTLPEDVKLAVASLVKHWWEKGAEAGIPDGVKELIEPWRTLWVTA